MKKKLRKYAFWAVNRETKEIVQTFTQEVPKKEWLRCKMVGWDTRRNCPLCGTRMNTSTKIMALGCPRCMYILTDGFLDLYRCILEPAFQEAAGRVPFVNTK